MSEIYGVNGTQQTIPQLRIRRVVQETPALTSREAGLPADRVEISEMATFMGKLRSMSDIRHNLVERIRAEIEAGTYETPERINATIEILLDEFGY